MATEFGDPASPLYDETIAATIAHIRERIDLACRRAGRSSESVQLMAVSKQQPAAAIVAAARCGIKIYGENRVQEFSTKRPQLPELAGAKFHMIGHLQSNKAGRAAEIFDAVDSLDSLALARKVNTAAAALSKRIPVLLEIKLSPEPSKTGLLPESTELTILLERFFELPALELRGLMTVPEWGDQAEPARPTFRRLRELRDTLAARHPHLNFAELSMGMSHDFEVAIEEGATTVRIGTAIFGPRLHPSDTGVPQP